MAFLSSLAQRRRCILLFSLVCLLVSLSFTVCAAQGDSAQDPILISTAQELQDINKGLNKHYKLSDHIDLTGFAWEPIGSKEAPFTGTFNGDNYAIVGLKIEAAPAQHYVGLFGYLKGTNAMIEKLVLHADVRDGITIAASDAESYIGSIAGYLEQGKITNCRVEALLNINASAEQTIHVGGLIGYCSQGIVRDNSVTGQLNAAAEAQGTMNLGGLIGTAAKARTIENESDVIIKADTSAAAVLSLGGLVGRVDNGEVIGNIATADLSSDGNLATLAAGGLIGHNETGTIERNNTQGTLAMHGLLVNVGGLVGTNFGNISSCYSLAQVAATVASEGQATVGGLVGRSSHQILTSFSRGNVTANGGKIDAGAFIGNLLENAKMQFCFTTANIEVASNLKDTEAVHFGRLIGLRNRTTNLTNVFYLETQTFNGTLADGTIKPNTEGEEVKPARLAESAFYSEVLAMNAFSPPSSGFVKDYPLFKEPIGRLATDAVKSGVPIPVLPSIEPPKKEIQPEPDPEPEIEIEEPIIHIMMMTIDNPEMNIDGRKMAIDSQGTAPMLNEEGRTYLPIRAVIEALGGTLGWDAEESKVTLKLNAKEVAMWIGKTETAIDGKTQETGLAPVISNGRTLVPLRLVIDCFELDAKWDGNTRTVTITYSLEDALGE